MNGKGSGRKEVVMDQYKESFSTCPERLRKTTERLSQDSVPSKIQARNLANTGLKHYHLSQLAQ
jgi:hypothetical protein